MANLSEKTFLTPLLERQLKSLQRSDKRGSAAAKRAETFIHAIACGQLRDEEILAKQTKYGELRLNNCRKFDLGSGYRLISLRDKKGLCFIFFGSHDECDRWLDRRRAEGISLTPTHLKPVRVSPEQPTEQLSDEYMPNEVELAEAEYDAYINSKLDEKTLRYLFRGLCGNHSF